jgi:hypothetical protein
VNRSKPGKPDPFAFVRGKVVKRIEVSTMQGDCAIGILFEDRTYLGFDLDPFLRITPDYSDGKTHNYKPLKTLATSAQRITRSTLRTESPPKKAGFVISYTSARDRKKLG